MKSYNVEYFIQGFKTITVAANSAEEALEEVERAFRGDECLNDDNFWIDQDSLWDIEWDYGTNNVQEVK